MNVEERIALIRQRLDRLLADRDRVILAIDGKCASGKTTLAARLGEFYHCNVLHMDEFFLRPEQRTPERFGEIGGNVDYERFREEVLLPLLSGREFSYRPFDCKTFTLAPSVPVTPGKLTVIEGSYSLHPYFGDPYDLKILLTVDEQTQRRRISERPAFLHRRFFEEWIPMENRYLEGFRIGEKADLIL